MEDLRWWSTDPDPRIVARIADPRIKVSAKAIQLPGSLSIRRILGVYRLTEYNFEAENPNNQPGALNYFVSADSYRYGRSEFIPAPDEAGTHEINNLRPVADGVAMVAVYEDTDRRVRVFAQYHPAAYEDTSLEGMRDYYFRLVAANTSKYS